MAQTPPGQTPQPAPTEIKDAKIATPAENKELAGTQEDFASRLAVHGFFKILSYTDAQTVAPCHPVRRGR